MGVWWQNRRRSRRSPRRLLGHFLETRDGAAEGVLGAMTVVLLLWLLWPEDSGPRLDQHATWQQSVEAAERRRATLEAEQADAGSLEIPTGAKQTRSAGEDRTDIVERPAEPARRRIAKPSELADPLDSFGRRPGPLAANASFQPAPRRPSNPGGSAADQVQTALTDVIDNLKTDPLAPADAGVASLSIFGKSGEPPIEVAVLSSEALDAEPLPEVDLSDLDTLVPLDNAEQAAVVPFDPVVPDEAAVRSLPDAAIVPFDVEQDADAPAANAPTSTAPAAAAPATDVGERPRDDAPSWLKNAVTAAVADERPIIAIVIDDLGLNRRNTAALNDLPSPLTLAFLPYAGRIEAQTTAAQAAGHELMLHLPMEPVGPDWPGPDALTTKIDRKEFTTRLEKNLDRFEGFVGINNHMGSRLTADSSRMEVVMRELRKRDVLFLDSKTSARSVAGDLAGRNGVPNTTRDIFLDHVIDLDSIRRQLARTEKLARRNGSAVAIGHPHGVTIQALKEWLPGLEARGFTLAPISAVVARRACSNGILIAADTCGRYLQARTPAASALAAKDG